MVLYSPFFFFFFFFYTRTRYLYSVYFEFGTKISIFNSIIDAITIHSIHIFINTCKSSIQLSLVLYVYYITFGMGGEVVNIKGKQCAKSQMFCFFPLFLPMATAATLIPI